MLKNYFITAFRNLRNNASHSVLNIVGLCIGMACCAVVFTIVNFEYSFDNWHKNKDLVYRVTTIYHGDNQTGYNGIVPYPTGQILNEIPEIEDSFPAPTGWQKPCPTTRRRCCRCAPKGQGSRG